MDKKTFFFQKSFIFKNINYLVQGWAEQFFSIFKNKNRDKHPKMNVI